MRLVSMYGNEVVYTNDKRKIEYLKSQGFKQKELPKQTKETPKKEGAKKNVRRKVDPEGNI